VEPGEYRERLELKSGVRVISREPRGAVLRLPAGAPETDPAVVAFEVSGAALSGFRILGDAATPLGSAIVVRNSSITLSDLEIAGAGSAAVEYIGSGGGSLVGSDLRDNPGAAIAIRTGASPRIAQNVFARNASSARGPAAILLEAGAQPSIAANTFVHLTPETAVVPLPAGAASALARTNWFIPAPAPDPVRRDGRGRR